MLKQRSPLVGQSDSYAKLAVKTTLLSEQGHDVDKNGATASLSTVPVHIASLTKVGILSSLCGRNISVWEISIRSDDPLISDWARHFRQSYCEDSIIDQLRMGTDLTREDYLKTMVFPHATQKPGPSIRSGDFAELLISDFLQYLQGFWVPRFKYQDKASPNESVKGSDIIGFHQESPGAASIKDTLVVCEVKAQLTGTKYNNRLQTAVADSSKDIGQLRLATTLNALKRRAVMGNMHDEVDLVTRFQKKVDSQFNLKSLAAVVLTEDLYEATSISDVDCSAHANAHNLDLIIVKGKQLMQLAHKLYEVAASEA